MKAPGFLSPVGVVLAIFTPGVFSNLMINNWCGVGVSLVQSHNAGCDYGTDGRCIRDGGAPWYIPSGSGSSILNMGYLMNGESVSIKISKDGVSQGVLQFEYSVAQGQFGGLYWDMSDLDGSGNGLVGTPFANDHVGITPTGKGSGTGTCVKIRCEAGKTCLDSYQHPDDPNTKYCPLDTGDIWLDLCMPWDLFIQNNVFLDTKQANVTHNQIQSRYMHFKSHQGHKRRMASHKGRIEV